MPRAWTDKTEYTQLSFQLARCREEPELAATVLPLLRVRWPALLPAAPPLSFCVPEDSGDLAVAVLCRAYSTFALTHEHADELARALDALRALGPRIGALVVLHNQDGRSAPFRERVLLTLASLQAAGLARQVLLLSRELLLRDAFDAMVERLGEAVAQRSAACAPEPGLIAPLAEVPLQSSELRADPFQLRSTSPPEARLCDPAALLLTEAAPPITFLIGEAGFGKTTAALRTFSLRDHQVLYVPGAQITPELNTKALLLQCLEGASLFAAAPPAEQAVLTLLARPAFEHLLKRPERRIAILLDGLDESFFLTRRGGLQILLNLLREVRAKVVLIARKEYWYARQGDFRSFFGIAAASPRPERPVRLIELLPWDDAQIAQLSRRHREGLLDPAQRVRLDRFIAAVEGGAYARYYGDIPRRPLFLRFILETVAHHDVHQVGRARLFAEWASLKILRDAAAGRPPILEPEEGADTTCALAFRAMERVAWHMAQVREGELELLPACALEDALRDDDRLGALVEPTGLLLNSLLIPTAPRSDHPLEVRFAHRAYQEYFLSRYLRAHPEALRGVTLPDGVREWLSDLTAEEAQRDVASSPRSAPRFPLPEGARWEDITFYYVDGHRLGVQRGAGGASQLVAYSDVGMMSRKDREPTRAWQILCEICHQGTCKPASYHADKAQISALRAALRRLFGLAGDPFLPFDGEAWRPRFRVVDHPRGERR